MPCFNSKRFSKSRKQSFTISSFLGFRQINCPRLVNTERVIAGLLPCPCVPPAWITPGEMAGAGKLYAAPMIASIWATFVFGHFILARKWACISAPERRCRLDPIRRCTGIIKVVQSQFRKPIEECNSMIVVFIAAWRGGIVADSELPMPPVGVHHR